MGSKKKGLTWVGFLIAACGLIYAFYWLRRGREEEQISTKVKGLEDYVRETYLAPHEVFEYAPAHQYKELGKVDVYSFLLENRGDEASWTEYLILNDGLYLVRYYYCPEKITLEKIDQEKNLEIAKYQEIVAGFLARQSEEYKDLAKELIFESHIKTRKGDFVFFILKKIGINSQDFEPDDLKRERLFWQSFVYIYDKQAMGPNVEISQEGPETGGYARSLWDIFPYHGREYILINKIVYEAHNFEIFEKTRHGLIKVHEFCYGGL